MRQYDVNTDRNRPLWHCNYCGADVDGGIIDGRANHECGYGGGS